MTKHLFIAALAFAPLALAGCKTVMETPDGYRATVQAPSSESHPHDGGFCPPGQAKKGNC